MSETYRVIVEGIKDVGKTSEFTHAFDGEPQINLTFERDGTVYKVVTRAHDEDTGTPTLHASIV